MENDLNTSTTEHGRKTGRDSGGKWKPGHSGNPSGRPPKESTWMQVFDEELNLIFKDSGVSTKREIARRLIGLALNGNLRAISEIIEKSEPNFQQETELVDLTKFAAAMMATTERRNA